MCKIESRSSIGKMTSMTALAWSLCLFALLNFWQRDSNPFGSAFCNTFLGLHLVEISISTIFSRMPKGLRSCLNYLKALDFHGFWLITFGWYPTCQQTISLQQCVCKYWGISGEPPSNFLAFDLSVWLMRPVHANTVSWFLWWRLVHRSTDKILSLYMTEQRRHRSLRTGFTEMYSPHIFPMKHPHSPTHGSNFQALGFGNVDLPSLKWQDCRHD